MKMEEKGLLIILSGPSGVGKGTVRQELMKDPSLNLYYSVSMTTRKQRPGEVEGREYYFVDEDTFRQNVKSGNLLEYAKFVGNYYGTPRDKVEQKRKEGKNVLLEIEVSGTLQVLGKLRDDPGVVSIFLVPPSLQDLECRIRGRKTECEEMIAERLEKARGELCCGHYYQHQVINDDLHRTVEEIASIIKARL